MVWSGSVRIWVMLMTFNFAIPFLNCFSGQDSRFPFKHSPFFRVYPSSQESQSSYCGPPQVRQARWHRSHSRLSSSTKKPSPQWSTHSPSGHTNTLSSFSLFFCRGLWKYPVIADQFPTRFRFPNWTTMKLIWIWIQSTCFFLSLSAQN